MVHFSVNAFWATSLYAYIHSSTVMRNLPSIIAMILFAPLAGTKTGPLSLPSGARPPDQVEEIAWPRNALNASNALPNEKRESHESGRIPLKPGDTIIARDLCPKVN